MAPKDCSSARGELRLAPTLSVSSAVLGCVVTTHAPRFERGIASFYDKWLEGLKQVARDDVALTTEVLGALERSLLMSATEVYRSAAPNIASLFSGHHY